MPGRLPLSIAATESMANRSSDLEIFRESFMHEVQEAQPDLSGYQDFLRYWKTVESEAMHVEDLGELDTWVRELARDKERVAALKNRADTMSGDKGGGATEQLVQILKLVLDILEAVERRLRRLRDERLSELASMLWKGGPGTTAKPKPEDKDKKKDGKGGKKEPETGDAAAQPAAAKMPEIKREKEKKMER